MDESDWLVSTDPQAMLAFLQASGKLSERKVRLFSVACCRGIWHLLVDERCRRAVEVAEQYADGGIGNDELLAAGNLANDFAFAAGRESGVTSPCDLSFEALCIPQSRHIVDSFVGLAAYHAASHAPEWISGTHGPDAAATWTPASCAAYAAWAVAADSTSASYPAVASDEAEAAARKAQFETSSKAHGVFQARLLLCLFASPFRSLPRDASLLTCNGGLVRRLAEQAYQQRQPSSQLDNARLAVLADALEECGVTDEDILGHLRQQGAVHVRGCAVLDLILGKE